jgi:hypothetical protein
VGKKTGVLSRFQSLIWRFHFPMKGLWFRFSFDVLQNTTPLIGSPYFSINKSSKGKIWTQKPNPNRWEDRRKTPPPQNNPTPVLQELRS